MTREEALKLKDGDLIISHVADEDGMKVPVVWRVLNVKEYDFPDGMVHIMAHMRWNGKDAQGIVYYLRPEQIECKLDKGSKDIENSEKKDPWYIVKGRPWPTS